MTAVPPEIVGFAEIHVTPDGFVYLAESLALFDVDQYEPLPPNEEKPCR
jgi:hypothetical protein